MTETNLKRYRVPMYVEAECLGVSEEDAADRVAAALRQLNNPGQELFAELRRGQPLKAENGDSRIFIHEADHVGTAALLGLIRLRRGERR